MVIGMQVACWIICRMNGWGYMIPLQLNRILKTAFGAWLGFFAIGLVLWGIYTGKFSPTEAAGVTVGFCIIAGVASWALTKFCHVDNERDWSEKSYPTCWSWKASR
jgi:C4-dicarboxylate transporter DctM subunit